MRNLLATLLLSTGAPMLVAGDELWRTQGGNNNAYVQDNEVSWLDWTRRAEAADDMLDARPPAARPAPAPPGAAAERVLRGPPGRATATAWSRTSPGSTPPGARLGRPDWFDTGLRSIGMYLDGRGLRHRNSRGETIVDESFLLLLHSGDADGDFTLPARAVGGRYEPVIDTAEPGGVAAGGRGRRRHRPARCARGRCCAAAQVLRD